MRTSSPWLHEPLLLSSNSDNHQTRDNRRHGTKQRQRKALDYRYYLKVLSKSSYLCNNHIVLFFWDCVTTLNMKYEVVLLLIVSLHVYISYIFNYMLHFFTVYESYYSDMKQFTIHNISSPRHYLYLDSTTMIYSVCTVQQCLLPLCTVS